MSATKIDKTPQKPCVEAVILAAGGAARFGAPKLLAPHPRAPDRPIIAGVVAEVLEAGLSRVIVVLGAHGDAIRRALADFSVDFVHNPRWAEGMSTSMRAGLEQVSENAQAVLFVLGDQPAVRAAHIRTVVDAYVDAGTPIVVPTFRGRRGNPALFDRCTFDALREIEGDQGGRALMEAGLFPLHFVEVPDPAVLLDVDTPEDLEALMERLHTEKDAMDQPTAASLHDIEGWIIDMDGVLYRGDTVLPGAPAFIGTLRRQGVPFLFLTNNSSRTPEQYVDRLRGMGIDARPQDVYTSALATAEYIREYAPDGARAYMIGMDGLREALRGAGLELVQDPRAAQFLVVGYDNQLTYDKLAEAMRAIAAGARFIGTNADPTLPVEDGFIPGAGAILAAVETASGVSPTVIGKPSKAILHLALRRLGLPPERTAILGDRLSTDVAGGLSAGMFTVLILTGSTTMEQAHKSDIKPHLIVQDMPELLALWRRHHPT